MNLRYELAIFGAFLAFIAILIAVMYVDILAVLISAASWSAWDLGSPPSGPVEAEPQARRRSFASSALTGSVPNTSRPELTAARHTLVVGGTSEQRAGSPVLRARRGRASAR